jgi:hypothetical protein
MRPRSSRKSTGCSVNDAHQSARATSTSQSRYAITLAKGTRLTGSRGLKAIATIEGNENRSGVTVNVNAQSNSVNIQPGYIIRLPAVK